MVIINQWTKKDWKKPLSCLPYPPWNKIRFKMNSNMGDGVNKSIPNGNGVVDRIRTNPSVSKRIQTNPSLLFILSERIRPNPKEVQLIVNSELPQVPLCLKRPVPSQALGTGTLPVLYRYKNSQKSFVTSTTGALLVKTQMASHMLAYFIFF